MGTIAEALWDLTEKLAKIAEELGELRQLVSRRVRVVCPNCMSEQPPTLPEDGICGECGHPIGIHAPEVVREGSN